MTKLKTEPMKDKQMKALALKEESGGVGLGRAAPTNFEIIETTPKPIEGDGWATTVEACIRYGIEPATFEQWLKLDGWPKSARKLVAIDGPQRFRVLWN